MGTTAHEPASLRSAAAIIVGNRDAERLRDLVVSHAGGPEHAAAERLGAELRYAIVVPQHEVPPEVVAVGSRVSFEGARTAHCVEVELAWPDEADPARGRVSVLSPVGLALLGATAWETVEYAPPDGDPEEVRIVSVAPGNRRAS